MQEQTPQLTSKEELEAVMNSEEEMESQAKDQVKQMQLHKFIQNKEQLFDKVKQLCDESIHLIERNLFQESNYFLEQAEEIIEFAANRGKQIDRNLIITVLFNRACSYQGYSSYQQNITKQKRKRNWENKHQQAIQTAKKAISVLEEIFKQLSLICQDKALQSESPASSIITSSKQQGLNATQISSQSKSDNRLSSSQKNLPTPRGMQSKQKPAFNTNNKGFDLSGEQEEEGNNQQNSNMDFELNNNAGVKKSVAKEEVVFSKIIQQQALHFLKNFEQKVIFDTHISDECSEQLKKARQSIYFWKNNPDNNERNMRQELNVPTKNTDDDNRNLVGVQKSQEWIEQFNIGSIMHMSCIQYDEFTLFEDIIFELSKKQLIEKMLLLSICFFTIATEIRFIELDKQKSIPNSKTQAYDLSKQESYKQSEIYHLKSIEIVCQAVTCYSPYITHLINSYHKHYNSSLELIEEEASILSQLSHNDGHEDLHISQKDTTLSKNTTGILESSELQETVNIGKQHNGDLQNMQKPYVTQKYMYQKLIDTQNKGSLSFNSFTNSSRSPQKDNKARKRSPQNNANHPTNNAVNTNTNSDSQNQSASEQLADNLTKRPKSQHTGASQENDISPLLNTVKITKSQVTYSKKALALDLETINSTFGSQQNSTSKNLQNKDLQNSIRKQNPPQGILSEENKKPLQPKQKENLSQNNMNQFSILRNYSLSNGSPRQSTANNPIKNIFQGKGNQQTPQTQQSQQAHQQQPYLMQNQLVQNQQQSQQQQQQNIGQQMSSSQQFQQQLQQQQNSLSAQQQQLLKALQNNKMNSSQVSSNGGSQQQIQQPKNMNFQQFSQFQNGQTNGVTKGLRVFTDLDIKNINESKLIEEKNGSQSHRSITTSQQSMTNSSSKQNNAQQISNQNLNSNIVNSFNMENKLANSILKSANSQRGIQMPNSSTISKQSSSQQPQYLKQITNQNNQYKNIKNEINISPKQTHHFLQQFDFFSAKNGVLSQQNSKEIQMTSSGQNTARGTQVPFNSKGIPKLDFNQIQNNPILKTEENIRFFSARDHSAKKINNYISKQN